MSVGVRVWGARVETSCLGVSIFRCHCCGGGAPSLIQFVIPQRVSIPPRRLPHSHLPHRFRLVAARHY